MYNFSKDKFSVRDGSHRGPARDVIHKAGGSTDPVALWSALRLVKSRMGAIENLFAQAEATGTEPGNVEQLTDRHQELANEAAILSDLLRRTGARPALGWD